jgi:hypothetical protein
LIHHGDFTSCRRRRWEIFKIDRKRHYA